MKALLWIVLAAFALTSQAQSTGVGLMLGNPTAGFTGKHWLSEDQAVDAGLGFSSRVQIYGDYLFHNKEAFYLNDVQPLDFYFGLGARMKFEDDIVLGLRTPVGLVHTFTEQSLDAFAEVAPILDFVSHYGWAAHFTFGGRYYF